MLSQPKERPELLIHIGRTSSISDIESTRKALHEHVEIKYFYEGSSTLLIGSQAVTATAGDIVVINPYEFHATVANGEPKGRYHLFMVPLDFFGGEPPALALRTTLLAKGQSFQTLFKGCRRMAELLQTAAKEYEKNAPFCDIVIKGLMTELFALLLREGLCQKDSSARGSAVLRAYELIEPALRRIRDAYTEPVCIDELAALCKLSKHYFCRVFKSVTAKTAMEYLKDYRLKVADALLANTQKSVSTIAEECGFESANYFCRCYKAAFGITPNKR